MMANCTGGCHLGTAPDDTAMPYLVYSAPGAGGAAEYNTGRQQIEELTTRLQVWANSPDTAAEIIERAEARILGREDGLGFTSMNVRKIGADCFQEPDRDADGNEVWQAVIVIELMIHWNPRA